MKLSNLLHKSEQCWNQEVEYYERTNYGGLIFTVRSNIDFFKNIYKILDVVYMDVRLGINPERISERVLNKLGRWSKIKSVKVNVEGKEVEILLSSETKKFMY